ncbi:uncharacterized protein LOC141708083 [Apium graveolens]|uniref:uncharacterized protein LOC141708083 n=1 Tax=Apium graveolens TaxID=4045 RepID=UPI003D79DFDB
MTDLIPVALCNVMYKFLAKEGLAEVMGVFNDPEDGKYLGLPSLIGRSKKVVFNFLKDQVGNIKGGTRIKASNGCHGREWGWERMGLAKNQGDLGFKDLTGFNLALFGKHVWKFFTNSQSLVARVFKARYYPNSHLL